MTKSFIALRVAAAVVAILMQIPVACAVKHFTIVIYDTWLCLCQSLSSYSII